MSLERNHGDITTLSSTPATGEGEKRGKGTAWKKGERRSSTSLFWQAGGKMGD